MKFRIEGMTCGHCVKTLTRAIHALDPSAQVSAQVAERTLVVTGGIDAEAAAQAIQEAGYSAQLVDQVS